MIHYCRVGRTLDHPDLSGTLPCMEPGSHLLVVAFEAPENDGEPEEMPICDLHWAEVHRIYPFG